MTNPRKEFDEHCKKIGNCADCDFNIHNGDRIDCLGLYSYQQGRADAIDEFAQFIDKHIHEVGAEICLDDDITILAEQLKEKSE